MINIEKRLKADLTVVEFLGLVLEAPRDLTGTRGYILITSDSLSEASRVSVDTINYCKEHDFIKVVPVSSRCHEYHITDKGVAFFNSRPLREKRKAGFN